MRGQGTRAVGTLTGHSGGGEHSQGMGDREHPLCLRTGHGVMGSSQDIGTGEHSKKHPQDTGVTRSTGRRLSL